MGTGLWLIPNVCQWCVQDLWVRGAQARRGVRQLLPSVRRARPRAARLRHRQLCHQGHDWTEQSQVLETLASIGQFYSHSQMQL